MKFYYKSVEENKDYIIIGNRKNIYDMKLYLSNYPVIGELVKIMYYSFSDYESRNGYTDGLFVIRKDSDLGDYVINHPETFIDDDENVSYDKVINSFLIALYEQNEKMSNKIYPLFKGKVSGMKDELSAQYSEKVVNYVLNNSSFKEHLSDDRKDIPKEYIIYDKYTYSIQAVEPVNRVRILVNNNN